jgi:hypothetical protein
MSREGAFMRGLNLAFAVIFVITGSSLRADDVFSRDGHLQKELKELGAQYIGDIRSYMLYTYDFSPKPDINGSVYSIEAANELKAARSLTVSQKRYHAFVLDPRVLAVTDVSDQYQIIAAIGCKNSYSGTSLKDLTSHFRRWESRFHFRLVGIGYHFIVLDVISGDADFEMIAKEIYSFCPDAVRHGTQTVAKLAEQIKENKSIYLWWTYNYGFLK